MGWHDYAECPNENEYCPPCAVCISLAAPVQGILYCRQQLNSPICSARNSLNRLARPLQAVEREYPLSMHCTVPCLQHMLICLGSRHACLLVCSASAASRPSPPLAQALLASTYPPPPEQEMITYALPPQLPLCPCRVHGISCSSLRIAPHCFLISAFF